MTRIRISYALVICLAACTYVAADPVPFESGASGLYLRLKCLQSPVSVLHVVAHPDDEDGAMLAYCARELGAHTMLFCLTRGEGGANLISNHFFDELGALRTLEHAKAASYYGNELFYSRAADYGYSKTLEEAMRKWENGIPLLEQLVEVIRRERPTILISRFAGDARDGHGHHQMAGVLSRQAFYAAADPDRFPEQLQAGLKPFKIQKLYVRAGSPWRPPKPEDWTTALPVGIHDPVLGTSPAQIARMGLGFQRSQGFSGHLSDPGPKSTYYRLEWTSNGQIPDQEDSLLDGLAPSWTGLLGNENAQASKQTLQQLDQQLGSTLKNWNARRPAETLAALLAVRRTVEQLTATAANDILVDHRRLTNKLEQAIGHAAGIDVTSWATTTDDQPINFAVPGETIKVTTRIANQGTSTVLVGGNRVRWTEYGTRRDERRTQSVASEHKVDLGKEIEPGNVLEISNIFELAANARPTRPYWSRRNLADPLYRVDDHANDHSSISRVDATPTLRIRLNSDSHPVSLSFPVHVRRRDPELGNVRYPLAIVPDKSIRFSLDHRVVRQGQSSFETSVVVRNAAKTKNTATVRLEVPPSWSSQPSSQEITFQREDEERRVTFQVQLPDNVEEKAFSIGAIVESEAGEFREGFQTVTARDLDRINVYHDAVQQVRVVDVRVLGSPNVAYVAGSGDRVAESLAPLDIYPTMLTEPDLASGDLSRFDVIIVGVRAYAVRDDVRAHNARLLNYVRRGGVLIVQYQTPEFDDNFGPYPYVMGRGPEEVSEEDAAVTILHPDHPLFHTPNRISNRDFDGWFEQRGSKFWESWDEQYTALLECHDQGQSPQQGGQLLTQFGNGVYVYSAYAWYRQLPRGVPGAYRIFANMLSLPETDLVER